MLSIPIRTELEEPEKILTLSDARDIAADRVRIEDVPFVIWWVMNRGYVILPKGERPKWFFVSEEEIILPPGD